MPFQQISLSSINSFKEESLNLVGELPDQLRDQEEIESIVKKALGLFYKGNEIRKTIEDKQAVPAAFNKEILKDRVQRVLNGLRLIIHLDNLLYSSTFPIPMPLRVKPLSHYLMQGYPVKVRKIDCEERDIRLLSFGSKQDVVKSCYMTEEGELAGLCSRVEASFHLLAYSGNPQRVVPVSWIARTKLATPKFDATLEEYMAKNRSSIISDPARLKILLRGLIEILITLKKQNIVHGDIKANNLAMDKEVVKIFDFGLSSLEGGPGHVDVHLPEYSTNPNASHKQDIWGMGMVILSLFSNFRDA